ncbi:hypothetical protein [Streptomyces sp. NPDC057582]|uniref:hypothetical protein n=1 Tax=Streptomyces sp. NPDC057582 TaxID=3346174 RepID=UPI00369CB816
MRDTALLQSAAGGGHPQSIDDELGPVMVGHRVPDHLACGVVALNLDGHRLPLPPEVARLVHALRDQRQERWQLDQTASTTPWLFPGQEPARPLGATYLNLKLRRHGIAPRAGRNNTRLALATDLPASVLADFTGTSISNATRWTGYAKREWLDYIASRKQD